MKVYFGMYYQAYGLAAFEVPDSLKNEDEETIREYIKDHWDEVPLPNGEYVPGSDEPDFDNFEIDEE